MSDYTISIQKDVYEQAQHLARQHSQQVDELINTRLKAALDESFFTLPDDEQSELKAMAYLSDDALFNMMREQMPRSRQSRMSVLMNKNSAGTISETEYSELSCPC